MKKKEKTNPDYKVRNNILNMAEKELRHAFKTENSTMVTAIAELLKQII